MEIWFPEQGEPAYSCIKIKVLFKLFKKNNRTSYVVVILKSHNLLGEDTEWRYSTELSISKYSTSVFVVEPFDLDCPYRKTAARWAIENTRKI